MSQGLFTVPGRPRLQSTNLESNVWRRLFKPPEGAGRYQNVPSTLLIKNDPRIRRLHGYE